MRQEVFDEQRSISPLIGIGHSTNETVIVAAGIEHQALPHFISERIEQAHVRQSRLCGLARDRPPVVKPAGRSWVKLLSGRNGGAGNDVHRRIYRHAQVYLQNANKSSGVFAECKARPNQG